jgi:hypothetical protein
MAASSDRRIPVARNTAITAASRHCWNDRPAQARSSRSSSPPAKTGTGLSVMCGGLSPAIGQDLHVNAVPVHLGQAVFREIAQPLLPPPGDVGQHPADVVGRGAARPQTLRPEGFPQRNASHRLAHFVNAAWRFPRTPS